MVLVSEVHVVGDVQVQVAVAVHVQKAGARPHLIAVGHAGLPSHVGERAVAVVLVEHVGAEIVHVQVQVAVVVVVGDGNAQPVAGVAHSGLLGHVGELPVAVVAIQGVAGSLSDFRPGQRRPVEKIDVLVAVSIVVEQRQSRRYGFHDVASSRTTVGVLESDPGLPVTSRNWIGSGPSAATPQPAQPMTRQDASTRQPARTARGLSTILRPAHNAVLKSIPPGDVSTTARRTQRSARRVHTEVETPAGMIVQKRSSPSILRAPRGSVVNSLAFAGAPHIDSGSGHCPGPTARPVASR